MRHFGVIAALFVLAGLHGEIAGQAKPSFERIGDGQVGYDLHGLTLAVDSRTQLLTVLQSLCGYWVVNADSSKYLSDIRRYFSGFENHPAVQLLGRIYSRGISQEIPYEAMLALDSNFAPDTTVGYPDPMEVIPGRDTAREFLAQIARFAKETDFSSFFEQEIPFYRQLLEYQVNKLGDFDEVGSIESFYTGRHDRYALFILPLDYTSKGINMYRRSGRDEAYFLCGTPVCEENEMRSKLHFTCLFWHEFGHTFVNPLTWKYRELVAKYSAFYGPIQYVRYDGYSNWGIAINEQIVRAGEVFIARKRFGPEAAERIIQKNLHAYFLYTREIYQAFLRYDSNRTTYRTFESYLPELLGSFDSSTVQSTKSRVIFGPRYFVKDSAIVIYPTGEEPSTQTEILDYVKTYCEKNLKTRGCILMPDTTALHNDLSGHSLLLIGTYNGNRFIAAISRSLPFAFSSDAIVGADTCRGTQLRLVISWYNPADPRRSALICTSNRPGNIIGILDVFPSWQIDYLLFDGKRIASAGYFVKNGGKWTIEREE